MDINTLVLPESNLNVAVNLIKTHLETLQDTGTPKQVIFRSVNVGPKLAPNNDEMPEARLWVVNEQPINEADQMYITGWVAATVELFLHFHHDDRATLHEIRNRLTRYVITSFQLFDNNRIFRFQNPGIFSVDHTNAFKRHTDEFFVTPPNYVTLIDVPIEYVYN